MRTGLRYLTDMRGIANWIIVVIVVVVIYVAGSAGSTATSGGGGSVPGAPRTCFTKCGFFMERRCEDNAYVGFCFPFWPCSAGIGAHVCATGGLPNERRSMVSETCQF